MQRKELPSDLVFLNQFDPSKQENCCWVVVDTEKNDNHVMASIGYHPITGQAESARIGPWDDGQSKWGRPDSIFDYVWTGARWKGVS